MMPQATALALGSLARSPSLSGADEHVDGLARIALAVTRTERSRWMLRTQVYRLAEDGGDWVVTGGQLSEERHRLIDTAGDPATGLYMERGHRHVLAPGSAYEIGFYAGAWELWELGKYAQDEGAR